MAAPKKGEADLTDLISMMGQVRGPQTFKLQQNGTTRIRIIRPVGSKFEIQPAYEHWVPIIDEKGEARKKVVICPKSMGRMEPCPICTLLNFFNSSSVPEIKATGGELRQNPRFLVYLIDRTYMLDMVRLRQKLVADPNQEKVYDARLPKMVIDKIFETIMDPLWKDCFAPTNGYDWQIKGEKKGNAMFTSYTVTPVPREHSPNYDPLLAQGLKPLDSIAPVSSLDDIIELVQAQLQFACDVGGDEGDELVRAFMEAWESEAGGVEVGGQYEGGEEDYGGEDNEGGQDGSEEDDQGSEGGEGDADPDVEGGDGDEPDTEGASQVGEDEVSDPFAGGDDDPEPEPAAPKAKAKAPQAPAKPAAPAAKPAPKPAAPAKRATPAESTAAKGEAAKTGGMPRGFADKLNSLRGGKK